MRQLVRRRALVLIAALIVSAFVASGCTAARPSAAGKQTLAAPPSSSSTTPTAPSSSTPSTSTPAPRPTHHGPPPQKVHIKLLNADGSEYGVGMPIIAFFSRRITNAAPLQKATVATVNGKRIPGAWYFETSSYYGGYPIEGHFRPAHFWPAHSHVFVKIPAKGLSAGHNMVYDDSLTSSWTTGPANIGVVNDATHRLTLRTDGKLYGRFPVSLGAPSTPTFRGIKVIMEQVPTVCMTNTAHTYNECGIKWDQRLTYTGEYLHSAPWNCIGHPGCTGPSNNIGHADSSNGCTNLWPQVAKRLYHFLRIGDVIEYPNADGPPMTLGKGYGDWNLSWSQWQTGGLVSTRA